MRRSKFIYLFIISILLTAGINGRPVKPVVLLVSLDGFRWDYPDRGLTPNLAEMERNGVRAVSLQPCFPTKTFPNHLSIITGLYPENHGIILNTILNPFTDSRYSYGKSNSSPVAQWYLRETIWETLKRQGVKTAVYFWPGSDIDVPYRAPDIFIPYKHETPYQERIQTVLSWLEKPEAERPQFITLYLHETDESGHKFGPESVQTDSAIALLDRMIGNLRRGLRRLELQDIVNLIIVSDHGQIATPAENRIDLEGILSGKRFVVQRSNPIMFIYPKDNDVYQVLKKNAQHYKVYLRGHFPEYYHFNHNSLVAPIVLVAEPGYLFSSEGNTSPIRATHGYDNHLLNMHGVFIAEGPRLKRGLQTGTLQSVDVYPLLCKLLDVEPAGNIDGRLERIEFVLNPPEGNSE